MAKTQVIPLTMIFDLDPCDRHRALLKRHFRGGVPVTIEAAIKALEVGLNVGWLIFHLLGRSAKDRYFRQRDKATRNRREWNLAYDAKNKRLEAASKAYYRTTARAEAACDREIQLAYRRRDLTVRRAQAARDRESSVAARIFDKAAAVVSVKAARAEAHVTLKFIKAGLKKRAAREKAKKKSKKS